MSEHSVEKDAGICEPKCHACGIGCGCTPRYVVTGPRGFTETLNAHTVETLVRLGLIEHERDGHVLEDGRGSGVGPMHHFYRMAPSVLPPGATS